MKFNYKKILPVAALFVLAFLLSAYCLRHNPSTWFDEGIYIQIANNLVDQDNYGIQTEPDNFEPLALISVGYPVYYIVGFFYTFLGSGFLQARMAAVLFLMLFIGAYYFLNRKLYDEKSAFVSTLLLITFAPLYGNGRNLLGDVPGLFFMAGGLIAYLYWEMSKYKNSKAAILSGLGFGLAMATKPNFLVLGGGILLALILGRKQVLKQLKNFWYFVLAGTVPVVYWAITQFQSIGVIKRVLEHYANPYARPDVGSLIGENAIRFFTESTPIHATLLAIVLIAGIVYSYKKKHIVSGTEWIIYFFVGFTLISYLRTPGWYRYFFLAHVWLIFMLAPSLMIVLKKKSWAMLATILLVFVQAYHLTTTDLQCSENKADRGVKAMQNFVNQNQSILFVNVPELVAQVPQNNYYQYLEINPRIIYGEDNLRKWQENRFRKIIMKVSEINLFEETLDDYRAMGREGGYVFLERK